jgi:predicted GNAT family acetyltransferase
MKIQYLESNNKCYIHAINDEAVVVSTIVIDINCDEYPRYKEYCNGDNLAKIIRVETKPYYEGKGYASKLCFAVTQRRK